MKSRRNWSKIALKHKRNDSEVQKFDDLPNRHDEFRRKITVEFGNRLRFQKCAPIAGRKTLDLATVSDKKSIFPRIRARLIHLDLDQRAEIER